MLRDDLALHGGVPSRSVVTVRAPAKINLALDVLGRRDDGYHELRSVMQTISLHDTLTLWKAGPGVALDRPGPEYSLIDRATDSLLAVTDSSARVCYRLEKRIPMAAGLGGGSSDAAAALVGVNSLLELGLGRDQLVSIGSGIGSDVPFFIVDGTALVEGRGERVTPFTPAVSQLVLLANPAVAVSTRSVFDAMVPEEYGDGRASYRVLNGLGRATLEVGRNDLAGATFRLFPSVKRIYDQLAAIAPGRAGLSGSGGTVFALFPTRSQAESARSRLDPRPAWTHVAVTGEGGQA